MYCCAGREIEGSDDVDGRQAPGHCAVHGLAGSACGAGAAPSAGGGRHDDRSGLRAGCVWQRRRQAAGPQQDVSRTLRPLSFQRTSGRLSSPRSHSITLQSFFQWSASAAACFGSDNINRSDGDWVELPPSFTAQLGLSGPAVYVVWISGDQVRLKTRRTASHCCRLLTCRHGSVAGSRWCWGSGRRGL